MSWIRHPLLDAIGVEHGFGTRESAAPPNLVRARQVHGTRVLRAVRDSGPLLGEADALVCDVPDVPIGVVTADCVPVLIAAPSGARGRRPRGLAWTRSRCARRLRRGTA